MNANVDYLTYNFSAADIYTTWQRAKRTNRDCDSNDFNATSINTRRENATWRKYAQSMSNLKKCQPERLGWSKDQDCLWLYAPFYSNESVLCESRGSVATVAPTKVVKSKLKSALKKKLHPKDFLAIIETKSQLHRTYSDSALIDPKMNPNDRPFLKDLTQEHTPTTPCELVTQFFVEDRPSATSDRHIHFTTGGDTIRTIASRRDLDDEEQEFRNFSLSLEPVIACKKEVIAAKKNLEAKKTQTPSISISETREVLDRKETVLNDAHLDATSEGFEHFLLSHPQDQTEFTEAELLERKKAVEYREKLFSEIREGEDLGLPSKRIFVSKEELANSQVAFAIDSYDSAVDVITYIYLLLTSSY